MIGVQLIYVALGFIVRVRARGMNRCDKIRLEDVMT